MKNRFMYGVVIFFLMTLLFASCKNSVDSEQPDLKQNYGTVSITFGGGAARTVLPSEITINRLYYVLSFTKTDGSENLTETQVGSDQRTLQLAVGTWDLLIRGYNTENDSTDTSKALVSYAQSGIVISWGESVTINVKLQPNLDNLTQNESGTMRYAIALPENVAGVLKIYTYPENTLTGDSVILSETENNGTLELASGYYNVSVSYEYLGKIKIWSDVAHINDNAITEIIVGVNDFTDYLPSPGPVDIYLSMDKFTMTDEGEVVFSDILPIALDKRTGDTRTIAVDNLVVVEWKVGNTILGSGDSITLNADVFPSGVYTLILNFLKNGKYWSSSIRFEVGILTGNLPADYYELITTSNYHKNYGYEYEEKIGTYRVVRGTSELPDEVYIPASYAGIPVTEIGDLWWGNDNYYKAPFRDKTNITAIHISEGIQGIGDYAFYGCRNLTNVTIPEGVTVIASRVFQYCTNLTSVMLPSTVQHIGVGNTGGIFYQCPNLTNIIVNGNNQNFSSDGVILYNKDKTEIIDYSLASGDVIIPKGVTSIGWCAFYGAANLNSIVFPSTLSSVDSDAFSGCTGLTSVTIPSGMTTIGNYMFAHCTNLTNISISETVTDIVWGAFYGCDNLTNIIIDERNPNYTSEDGIIYNKEKTEILFYPSASGDLTIPFGVTTIGDMACYGAGNLSSLVISEGVTSIEWGAFDNCFNLTSVIIPSTVTSIGSSAFGSSNIISVTFEGTIEEKDFSPGGGGNSPTFVGDLRDKYLSSDGGIGTYTRSDSSSTTWTKQ